MSHGGRPPEEETRRRETGRTPEGRDITPAVGRRGGPGVWKRARKGARPALARPDWGDAKWSFLYDKDTRYAARGATNGSVPEAARRMRGGEELRSEVQGPIINAVVWTWEIPVYFWFGGMAAGSSFAAVAADLAGDEDAARVARAVALAAVLPCPPLLIADLGRPMRFLHMMRIFKPRSPMSMGSWCLVAFSSTVAAAVGADWLGLKGAAKGFGAATAALGTYLGSYTGVLLASTATPVWARSHKLLPGIFICTAAATGAAANRFALAARGAPAGDPSRDALAHVETVAMGAELALSMVNERGLGILRRSLEEGRPGRLFSAAKWAARAGLALRAVRTAQARPWAEHASSAIFMAAALLFRFAWLEAGKASAHDDEAVAIMHRRPREGQAAA
jgi:formate-dependent nitrite reductase membrane component NrfD